MGKILIVGGQMENKGAQAMTFTVINEIRNRFPGKEIIVNCQDKDKNYNFHLLRIGKKLKLEMIGGLYGFLGKLMPKASNVNVNREEMEAMLKDTDLMIDISGFALSSQFSFRHSLNYMANIMLAKKYNVPMVLMSQSFGPFNYKGIDKMIIPSLIRKHISYPKRIYAREFEGQRYMSQYTRDNLHKSVDIVLQGSEFNIDHLFKPGSYQMSEPVQVQDGSVAIIPNVKTMKYGSREEMINLYQKMVDQLLLKGKHIYLLRHSTEDLEICKEIKQRYPEQSRVVLLEKEYDCIEIHHILNQFDFIIGSRYHSIIHAYKNGIPVLALGWATKYKELLGIFGQSDYIFDVRDLAHAERTILMAIDQMIDHREEEAAKIRAKMDELSEVNIFNEVFNDLPVDAMAHVTAAETAGKMQGEPAPQAAGA
ncbi:polysaccharide pyruvyl transferase family protein [Paenibacillus daejeonensis]|uniref:polysaccharide pyruvyl transferase family protein n=1 Tax=Paenibacillus daejeonensis TaxID=135193 RepID=UPI000368D353|nr:polysaccharide pyruvyl transferase family protein [Paenibacillus daejeonensis]